MLSPKRVLDLAVVQESNSVAVLSYTEVGDGEGKVAKLDLRFGEHPIQWGDALVGASSSQIPPLDDSAIGKKREVVIMIDAGEPSGPTAREGSKIDFQTLSFRGNLRTGAVPFPDPPATFPDPGEDGSRLGNVATLTIEHFEELPTEPPPEEDPAMDPESREVLVRKERVKLWKPFPWALTPWGKFSVYVGEKLGDVEVPE